MVVLVVVVIYLVLSYHTTELEERAIVLRCKIQLFEDSLQSHEGQYGLVASMLFLYSSGFFPHSDFFLNKGFFPECGFFP